MAVRVSLTVLGKRSSTFHSHTCPVVFEQTFAARFNNALCFLLYPTPIQKHTRSIVLTKLHFFSYCAVIKLQSVNFIMSLKIILMIKRFFMPVVMLCIDFFLSLHVTVNHIFLVIKESEISLFFFSF